MSADNDSPFALIAKFQKSIPVDIEGLARALGITVSYVELGQHVSGALMRDARKGGPSGFAILVNFSNAPNRQRFTLAHEIAHFVLHRDLIDTALSDDTMYRSFLSSEYETQANRLAADILMPIMVVKGLLQRGFGSQEMAARFRVSEQAMKIRVDGLRRPA
jgi:hypothetical protein